MLSLVKAGYMDSLLEKRINCSINTWIRGPGITMFVTIATAMWMKGENANSLSPYIFVPSMMIAMYNGQYYAQRVIGNYYIKKALALQKEGKKVTGSILHAS